MAKRWWAFSPGDGWHTCTPEEAESLLKQGLDGRKVFCFEDYGADIRAVAAMKRPAMVVGPGISDEQMKEAAEAFARAIGHGFRVSRSPYLQTGTIMFIEQELPPFTLRPFGELPLIRCR